MLTEDVALHGDTKRQGNDIEQQEVSSLSGLSLAREDTSLNSGTVRDSLVRVDALLELLVVEELAEELLYPGDTGGATNEHDLVNLGLVDAGVLEDLLDWLESAGEGLGVEVLETGTGDGCGEVLAVEEGVDLDGGGRGGGQGTLGTLAGCS